MIVCVFCCFPCVLSSSDDRFVFHRSTFYYLKQVQILAILWSVSVSLLSVFCFLEYALHQCYIINNHTLTTSCCDRPWWMLQKKLEPMLLLMDAQEKEMIRHASQIG